MRCSWTVGRRILEAALDRPELLVALEMGGKNACVVLDDCQLRQAVHEVIVGGYLSNWIPTNIPDFFEAGFRVVQDILPNALTERADVLLPAAAWAEKDGSWENFAGKIQPFAAAVAPPNGAKREGDVYYALLNRTGLYNADEIRKEMGEPFAALSVPTDRSAAGTEPVYEFAEL